MVHFAGSALPNHAATLRQSRLGWARIVTGRFFPSEIAMTIVVGVSAIVGIATCARWRTSIRWSSAAVVFLLFAVLQVLAMRLSLIPYIAQR